jgi:hypothetical protein
MAVIRQGLAKSGQRGRPFTGGHPDPQPQIHGLFLNNLAWLLVHLWRKQNPAVNSPCADENSWQHLADDGNLPKVIRHRAESPHSSSMIAPEFSNQTLAD